MLAAMKSHQFDFMGSARSYWNFFFGYDLFVALTLLVAGILFWQPSTWLRQIPPRPGGLWLCSSATLSV